MPVVFVHGLGGESLDWDGVTAALAKEFDTYALDLPGFGCTPPPEERDLSLDALTRAVVATLESLDRGPVHLVGNSLGGAVCVRVAAEHPQLVRSLALLSPAMPDLRPRWWSAQVLVALVPFLGSRVVAALLRGDPDRMARRVFGLCYGDPRAVTPAQYAAELAGIRRRAALPHSPGIYTASLRGLVSAYFQRGPRRLWRQAATIGVPTLVVYGGRDKLVDPRMAWRARRTFPQAQVVRLPEEGHVPQLEHPARIAGVLRKFLAGVAIDAVDLPEGMDRRHGTVEGSDFDLTPADGV